MTQQVGLHQSQLDGVAVDAQFEFAEVDDSPVEGKRVGGRRLADAHPLAAPQQTLQARQQDGKLERFGKIVVGPGSEALKHIFGAAARSQHKYGNEILRRAQLGGDGKTVLAGKHDVEHDGIELLALRSLLLAIFFVTVFPMGILLMTQQQLDGALTVARNLDPVTFGFEIETQTLSDVRFVLDDQNAAHARFSRTALSARLSRALFPRETLRGSSTTTVVPWPSPRLSAKARPPCFLAMARTMNRPRPVPLM